MTSLPHRSDGNQTDTTLIMFCTQCPMYPSSMPTISWTSRFSESVGIRHLTCLRTKLLKESDETWETMTSESVTVIELDRLSSPSFLALQPYTLSSKHRIAKTVRFQCYTTSLNLNLVESTNIFLDPSGCNTTSNNGETYLGYSIFCCVRPKSRCCVNEMPIEVLEHIFSSFDNRDHRILTPKLSKVIPLVCKIWNKLFVAFEEEPIKAKVKFARLKQSPGKRFKWSTCHYDGKDDVNFDEYIHAVVQFQPFLQLIEIYRPLQDSTLDSLSILAKVPTIERVMLYHWEFPEVFGFLRARQHLTLTHLTIFNITRGNQDPTDVTPSNMENESQLFRVKDLELNTFDVSIHKTLNFLRKDYLQNLWLTYNPCMSRPLQEPIRLFGYENLTELRLYGEAEESNLVSFDFIYKTCTPSNFPKLHTLDIQYCFIDPTQVQYLLRMPSLENVNILFFESQKTAENVLIAEQAMMKFQPKHDGSKFEIRYGY